ncbi:hypothetical protein [Jiangella ureilytica]|uniref:hypothetical protein n=1 Tax=Jiangella ureilytica TaxID=2530374 RepID=UPI0013A5CD4D|nr:hypothetical protein [Jiangella ureilytica]
MAGGRWATLVLAGVAVVAALVIGIVAARDGDDDAASATDEPAGLVEGTPAGDGAAPAGDGAAPADMYSLAELTAMWDALGTAQVAGIRIVYIHSEWADLEVQADPGVLHYDEVEYDGELGSFEAGGVASGDDPAAVFFPLAEVDPAVIAAVAARADEVAGYEGRPVSLVVVERNVFYGDIVTIRVHLEADAYGVSPSLTWDASGQHLLDDGSDR